MLTTDLISQAKEYWKSGNDLEAGRLLFEGLSENVRPRWAANILCLVICRTRTSFEPIERVIGLVGSPEKWNQAHDAFSGVRKVVLQLEQLPSHDSQQLLLLSQLMLAELVAKVTYNATNPPDEFDEDSGWWMAPCLRDTINLIGDPEFSEAMWLALCSEPPLPRPSSD